MHFILVAGTWHDCSDVARVCLLIMTKIIVVTGSTDLW